MNNPCYKTVPFLQSKQILSVHIKHHTVTGLSLFILENSLRLTRDRIVNRLYMSTYLDLKIPLNHIFSISIKIS